MLENAFKRCVYLGTNDSRSIGKRGSTTGGAPSTTRDVMTVLLQVNLFIIAVQE